MFSVSMWDKVVITKNYDGTYKVEGSQSMDLHGELNTGLVTINRALVKLDIEALTDDDKAIMTINLM